jgi:enoyl-CoA hydratase/3-hydroxyacyl-CoA dehydrogenase
VLTGYGTRAFCAGGDIGRFPSMLGDADASAQYARDCSRLLRHLDGMHKPVVAALNGMALGGGFELAARCHDIVALRDAWLQMPEITLGIAHGIGAMVVPYRKWPHAAATFNDMLRLATRLDAGEAHRLGIFSRLCDDHTALLTAAVARVGELAGHVTPIHDGPVDIPPMVPVEPVSAAGQPLSGEVIGMIERAVAEAAAAPTLSEALEVGHRVFGESACTAAAREGIGAFVSRRKPDFSKLA